MLDKPIMTRMRPYLEQAALFLAAGRVTPNMLTLAGLVLALACALALVWRQDMIALALLALSRLCDGLDGALARATERKSDLGGFLDIVFDFVFYGAIPLAFAWRDPACAFPAAVLLFSFYVNGASVLAFAAMAAKRGLQARLEGEKSLVFTTGLAEGSETIAVFAAMILFPQAFAWLAYGFALICLITAGARIFLALRILR